MPETDVYNLTCEGCGLEEEYRSRTAARERKFTHHEVKGHAVNVDGVDQSNGGETA